MFPHHRERPRARRLPDLPGENHVLSGHHIDHEDGDIRVGLLDCRVCAPAELIDFAINDVTPAFRLHGLAFGVESGFEVSGKDMCLLRSQN